LTLFIKMAMINWFQHWTHRHWPFVQTRRSASGLEKLVVHFQSEVMWRHKGCPGSFVQYHVKMVIINMLHLSSPKIQQEFHPNISDLNYSNTVINQKTLRTTRNTEHSEIQSQPTCCFHSPGLLHRLSPGNQSHLSYLFRPVNKQNSNKQ